MGGAYGLEKLGAEKLHPIVARGILIDLAASRGDMNAGECASMDDINAALEAQGMADFEFASGDAILFRYGWEQHWEDPPKFNEGSPGICMDVARWIDVSSILQTSSGRLIFGRLGSEPPPLRRSTHANHRPTTPPAAGDKHEASAG